MIALQKRVSALEAVTATKGISYEFTPPLSREEWCRIVPVQQAELIAWCALQNAQRNMENQHHGNT